MSNQIIRCKAQMYRMLANGAFGNTIPQYFDLAHWETCPDAQRYPFWGIRTQTAGGPCRLSCPQGEVRPTVESFWAQGHKINISLMVDTVRRVTLWADIYDTPTGLLVYGIENPPNGASWRALMPSQGTPLKGVQANLLLRKHLSPSSLADLDALREQFPSHVYELSACDRPIGTIPGRNAVLWEVRNY